MRSRRLRVMPHGVNPTLATLDGAGPRIATLRANYLFELATFFPSDLIVRALASIRRVVELPFSPVPGIDDDDGKAVDWGAGHGIGFAIVVAAIVLALAANLRIGLFLIFFLLYFGALPAIQFDHRHFFYLIFITWWAGGFLIQAAIDGRPLQPLHWLQAVAIPAGLAVAFALVLWAARTYQQPVVRALLSEYLSASREPIPAAQLASPQQGVRAAPQTDPETADFIVVDLNGSRCSEHAAVGFQYDDPIRKPYGRVFTLPPDSRSEGLTHIFMPIYDGFGHLDLPTPDNGCVAGVYRVEILDDCRWSLKPFFLLAGDASRCISVSRTDNHRGPASHHSRAAPPRCQALATLPCMARVRSGPMADAAAVVEAVSTMDHRATSPGTLRRG